MAFNISKFKVLVEEINNSSCGLIIRQEVCDISKNLSKLNKVEIISRMNNALKRYEGNIKIVDKILIEDFIDVLKTL